MLLAVPAQNFYQGLSPSGAALACRRGDFSELLPSRVIKDPLTGNAFPGNIIPSNRLNPLSQKVQEKYFPLPNRGATGALTSNYAFLHPYPNNFFKIDYLTQRIDHKISENNELSGRVTQDWAPYLIALSFPGLARTRTLHAGHIAVSDTHTFSPSLVNSFRFGWVPLNITDGKQVDGFTPPQGDQVVAELGLQGVNPRGLKAMGFPNRSITGYPALSVPGGGIAHLENIFSYADSMTWIVRKHILKFGGELRTFSHLGSTVAVGTYGSFSFNGSITGYGYGDFFLGIPFSSTRLDPLVKDVANLDRIVDRSQKLFPGKSIVLTCSLWDYTFQTPMPLSVLKRQWNRVLDYVQDGRISGYVIFASFLIDSVQEQARWVRDFIAAN
ncbi:MAG TPA: hypothetical protein VGK99_24220 [Acidobacteriota bacterium]